MDKNLTIKERILTFLEMRGIKKTEFFQRTGIQSSNFKGKNLLSQIGGDMIVKILTEYKELSPSWLMLGEGNMLSNDIDGISSNCVADMHQINTEEKGIPLVPIEAAAGFFQGEQNVLLSDCKHFQVSIFPSADYLIPIKGDSMLPNYSSGDIVACQRINARSTFFQWGKVYVVDTEQGVLIKRLFEGTSPATIRLVSDNAKYPPIEVPRAEIYHMSVVLGTLRLE